MTFDPIRIPTNDASSPVPIPKSGEVQAANSYWRATDELSRFESGERGYIDPTKLGLPQQDMMSLFEFVRLINQSIAQFEKTRDALELMDRLMNKRMHQSFAHSSVLLRRYRSKLQSHVARWGELEDAIEELRKRVNERISRQESDINSDKKELAAYNNAVMSYNDKESSGYRDEELLAKAYERYNNYRGSALSMRGRESEIASYNALIAEYNEKSLDFNETIVELNGERENLRIDKLSLLKELPMMKELPAAGHPPVTFPAPLLDYPFGEPLPLLAARERPNPQEFMHLYYDPVESASVGFLGNLNTLLSPSHEYEVYDRMMKRLLSPIFLDMLMVKFAKIALGGEGGGMSNSHSLLQAVSWATLEKLFSGQTLRTGTIEARIQFSMQEIEEMQLMMMNLLSKISIQAATGPAFETLGSDIGHVGIGDKGMGVALSLGFMERIVSAIESGAVKSNVEALIANNPKLGNFPQGDQELIARKLNATINLMLLQNGLLNAAATLEAPGLVAKTLGFALENSGVKKTLGQTTVNDALRNRGNSTFVEALMADKLASSGFDSESAAATAARAMQATVANLPFRNGAQLANHLALELYNDGVSPLSLARPIAQEAISLLLELSPKSQYEDLLLNAQFTLALIPQQLLTTEKAKRLILSGYDRNIFDALYQRAIDLLYKVNSSERLVNELINQPGNVAVGEEPAPRSVRDMMIQLYRRLVRQGVSVEDSLGIAEATFRYIFRSKGAEEAFALTPSHLKLQVDSFKNALSGAGLTEATVNELVAALILASLTSPQEAGDIGLAGQVTRGISAHEGSLATLLGQAAVSVLGREAPQLGDELGATSYAIAESALRSPGALESEGALFAALRRATAAGGFNGGATQLAEEILREPVQNERLRLLSSPTAGYPEGSTASLLLDSDVNGRLLQERLRESHLSQPLAAEFSKVLLPYLPHIDLLNGNFRDRLTALVASELPASKERANEIVASLGKGALFDTSAIERRLGEALYSSGEENDLTEAMARASVVTKNAEHVQGALNDMLFFQNAILTNLAVGWGVDKNLGSDLVRAIAAEEPVDKSALKEELLRAIATTSTRAEEIAAASFSTSEGGGEDLAVKHAVKEALAATLHIDDALASTIASKVDANALFDSDQLKGQTAELLSSIGRMGSDEALQSAEEIVNRTINNPGALDSARDFQKAFQDAATVVAVSPESAAQIGQSLRLDHIMHPELLELAAARELSNAGFSDEEAKKLASQAAKNLFQIGSSEIDLHMTTERLKSEGANGSIAIDQLVHSLMATAELVKFIKGNALSASDAEELIALSVEKSIAHRQSAASEELFRKILRDELVATLPRLDSRAAEAMANEAVITEGLRKELFIQELNRRFVEKVDDGERYSDQLRIVADEVFRTITAFSDKATFDNTLKAALKKRGLVENIAADEIVASLHAGIVLESAASLFTTNSSQLPPQIELRNQLSEIITETFNGAIAPDKAKRISEEFITILLGPLSTAQGKVGQESILQLVEAQLQELIGRVDTKNYRKLIVQGVTDTMTSYAQFDFDTFLYTETLNANGMQFLKIIQKALLNNIGVEDRDLDKTIDLLI